MHIELKSLIAHKQLPVFRFNAATKKLFGFIGSWVFLIALVVVPAWAQDGQALFQEKCSACHSIGGGDVLGPDLKGVTAKRDHEWLEHWIREPEEMISQGDPLATQLLKQYNDMPMPSAGLSPAEVNAVLAYIEAQSGSGATPPSGAVAEPVPLGNPSVGQALFTGAVRLQNGGTSCLACHTVAGVGALGGGNMGPDLTHVYSRMSDRGVATALNTLPFPTMKPLYVGKPLTPEEQGDLRAFFAEADKQAARTAAPSTGWIWGISGLGVIMLFGIMVVLRPRQYESVSEMLKRKVGQNSV